MNILNEGGNIFKDPEGRILTQRINKADVLPTLKWLEQITDLPHEDFMLGSTGKKETSGDLDVAVNQKEVTKNELVEKLAAWCKQNGKDPKAWIRKTGISVHFLTPIRGNESNGYVQTDLMFGDPEWMKWSMAGSNDSTAYSGADRQILMSSIATAQGLKWSPNQGLIDRESNEVITRNPQEIAQHLIGPNGQADDLESVETILTKLRSRVDYPELIADAEANFAKRGIKLPESADITRLKNLAGVQQINEAFGALRGISRFLEWLSKAGKFVRKLNDNSTKNKNTIDPNNNVVADKFIDLIKAQNERLKDIVDTVNAMQADEAAAVHLEVSKELSMLKQLTGPGVEDLIEINEFIRKATQDRLDEIRKLNNLGIPSYGKLPGFKDNTDPEVVRKYLDDLFKNIPRDPDL